MHAEDKLKAAVDAIAEEFSDAGVLIAIRHRCGCTAVGSTGLLPEELAELIERCMRDHHA
jgi:hypothetical protein